MPAVVWPISSMAFPAKPLLFFPSYYGVFTVDFNNPADYEELVEHSLKEILQHEDFTRFLSWMKQQVGATPQLSLFSSPDEHLLPMATNLALAIWNGTPLPGNNFRPQRISMPKRNQPCLCGSGKKYKKCCFLGEQQVPDIDEDMIWPLLMDAMPAKTLKKGLRDGTLPINARVYYCAEVLDEDSSDKVIQLLQDYYFASSHKEKGEHAAYGLTLLFDAFDRQNMWERKLDLIDHICDTTASSPLRSEALQRLATIQADAGDLPEAFKSLKKARKDTPDNPDVGLLEIQLLLVKGDFLLARQRARFIAKQVRRQNEEFPDELSGNPMLEFLEHVIDDPEMAASIMGGMHRSDDSALLQWLEKMLERPVAPYLFNKETGFADGIEDYSAVARPHFRAEPKPALQKLENGWNDVCPIEPLFGVSLAPFNHENPWEEASAPWKEFLFDHPEALDSMAVVDDLLTILSLHPAWGQPQVMEGLFEPLLSRGMAIVADNLKRLPEDGCLPWLITENRPFIRTLVRTMINARFQDDFTVADRIAKQILNLNPADNHGLRAEIINRHLWANNDTRALEVADNFPGDTMPDILYGRVLALYRSGRKEEALDAAREAKSQRPKVASYLISPQRKEPRESSRFGIEAGGRLEAWEYRADMREIWKETRGILTWLKKV